MITYNHCEFITQAVESVMRQETTFDVELVVGEDCSTDSTRAVLLDLAQRYTGRIRLLLRTDNLGIARNLAETFKACTGEFVAMLEGDDF